MRDNNNNINNKGNSNTPLIVLRMSSSKDNERLEYVNTCCGA